LLVAAVLGLALTVGSSAAVFPPKLQYDISTLPNGLTLVLSEDHSTPIVHLQMWYHVGAKNERPGRTGFAHLFEHLMFKGSRNVGPEEHTSRIASVGGQSNAYTTDDETVFWETVPSQYLPLVMWLEADRMASLRIDKTDLTREREVVKEERRMRIDNQPCGALSEIIYEHTFTTHPYQHPTIGSMADLEAASIEDVREFYETYYVPQNATVVLVGDFDTAQAKELAAQYFGRVPASDRPVPRDIPKEPAQTEEYRVNVTASCPLPAVVVAYHIPYDGHPDSYPLHAASKVLSDGQSSRIYQSLVYGKQIAVSAFGQAHLIEDPNVFYAVAFVQPGHSPEEAADALIAEFDRLTASPITDRELQRAKNQFARDYILGRETNQQKALALGHAAVIHGDVSTADGELEIFQNLTVDDVQRVAQTYFGAANRTVITVMPFAANGAQGR
jgi:zinc protease